MSITAIVASKRLAILERIIVPAFPKKRVIGRANQNIAPAIPKLISRARAVNDIPYTLASSTEVVSTAGPVIIGTPRGTAPRVSGSTSRCLFSPVKRSLKEMTKSSMPPATMKSETVMVRARRMVGPIARKTRATADAVMRDWTRTLRLCGGERPSVSVMKMGRTPRASTATKRGTKHRRKMFIVRVLPSVSAAGLLNSTVRHAIAAGNIPF